MPKSGCPRRVLAMLQNLTPNSSPGPLRMHKDRSNLRRIDCWIEQSRFSSRPMVAAEKRLSVAPSSAADWDRKSAAVPAFRNEISLVGDQLGVQTEYASQRPLDLSWSVISSLKAADRVVNQSVKRRNVLDLCDADLGGR